MDSLQSPLRCVLTLIILFLAMLASKIFQRIYIVSLLIRIWKTCWPALLLADMVEQATVNVEPHPTSLPVLDNSSNSKRLAENGRGKVGSETLLLIKVRIILSSLYPSWDSYFNIIPSFLFKQRVQMAQVLLLAVLLQPKYYKLIKTMLIITQELRVTCLPMHQLKCPTLTTNINFNRHSFLKRNHQIVEPCALQPPRLLIPSTCSMVW